VDGGVLLVNPAEASASLFPMFTQENLGDIIVYRKTSQPIRIEPRPAYNTPIAAPIAPLLEPEFVAVPLQAPIAPAASVPSVLPTAESPREIPLVLARAYADQGRLEEALASCRDAIAVDRTDPTAHFLYAAICHELDRPEEAIAALGKVLYLDQDFVLAHHALGGLYKQLGKQKESGRHLAVALDLLSAKSRDEIVPESDGMTCGRLVESVRAMAGE